MSASEIRDDSQRARLLAEVAGAVAWSPDASTALRRVAELTVPRLADWCAVDVLDGDTSVQRLAVVHGDPGCRAHAERLLGRWEPGPDRAGVARVIRTGEREVTIEGADPAALVPGPHAESERVVVELGVAGYVSVPLRTAAGALGALTLVAASPRRRFVDADVSLVETVGRMAALPVARARLDHELAAVGRRQDDVLAALSHELRTPLTAMMAWLQLLHHPADVAESRRALHIIERNGRRLGRLIDDLMDASDIVLGRLSVERRPVDLPALVHGVAARLAEAARHKGVRVQLAIEPDVGPYAGDAARLQQVVDTLLSNAITFTPAGGRVLVRLEGDAGRVRLCVRDTGRGIARELLPHVFDVFRRGDHASGLGIGLAIARGLVTLHGGTVQASSEGEGRGAMLTVVLPRR